MWPPETTQFSSIFLSIFGREQKRQWFSSTTPTTHTILSPSCPVSTSTKALRYFLMDRVLTIFNCVVFILAECKPAEYSKKIHAAFWVCSLRSKFDCCSTDIGWAICFKDIYIYMCIAIYSLCSIWFSWKFDWLAYRYIVDIYFVLLCWSFSIR